MFRHDIHVVLNWYRTLSISICLFYITKNVCFLHQTNRIYFETFIKSKICSNLR